MIARNWSASVDIFQIENARYYVRLLDFIIAKMRHLEGKDGREDCRCKSLDPEIRQRRLEVLYSRRDDFRRELESKGYIWETLSHPTQYENGLWYDNRTSQKYTVLGQEKIVLMVWLLGSYSSNNWATTENYK